MKQVTEYFFGTESISLADGFWFYGFYLAVAAITAFVMFSIY